MEVRKGEEREVAYKRKYEKYEKKAMVTWKMHQNVYECEIHGVISSVSESKSICSQCIQLKEEDRCPPPKAGLQRVLMKKPIGEFHQIMQKFVDEKFRMHEFLIEVCGPRWCGLDRSPVRLVFLDNGCVLVFRDYTDRLSFEYNDSAMSVGIGGGNKTVGMEGFLLYIPKCNLESQSLESVPEEAIVPEQQPENQQEICHPKEMPGWNTPMVIELNTVPQTGQEPEVVQTEIPTPHVDDEYFDEPVPDLDLVDFNHYLLPDAVVKGDRVLVDSMFMGSLSDLVRQDAKTSFANGYRMISILQNQYKLIPKYSGSVLYIRSDGCPKQYKSAAALRMVGILAYIFGIEIDWMICAPHHGKNLVDALAGRDKHDLNNAMIRGMESAQRDEFFRLLSEAEKACKYLNNRPLVFNRKKRRGETGMEKLKSRTYHVSNYEQNTVPMDSCQFNIRKKCFNKEYASYKDGKPVGRAYTSKVGLRDMYHFRFHWKMPKGWTAVRRVPCLCDACHSQLAHSWIAGKEPRDQDKFLSVSQCRFNPIMNQLNDWHFVHAEAAVEKNEGKEIKKLKEENAIYRDMLHDRDLEMEASINDRGWGVVAVPNGVQLIQWIRVFPLTEPTEVENCGKESMNEGTVVAEGWAWLPINKMQHWYEPPLVRPPTTFPKKLLFRMRDVLDGDIKLTTTGLRPPLNALRAYNQTARNLDRCIKVNGEAMLWATNERDVLYNMQLVPIHGEEIWAEEEEKVIAAVAKITELSKMELLKKRLVALTTESNQQKRLTKVVDKKITAKKRPPKSQGPPTSKKKRKV